MKWGFALIYMMKWHFNPHPTHPIKPHASGYGIQWGNQLINSLPPASQEQLRKPGTPSPSAVAKDSGNYKRNTSSRGQSFVELPCKWAFRLWDLVLRTSVAWDRMIPFAAALRIWDFLATNWEWQPLQDLPWRERESPLWVVRLVHSVRYVQISGVQGLLAYTIYLQIGSFFPLCCHTFRAFLERCLQSFPVSSAIPELLVFCPEEFCVVFFLCEWLNSVLLLRPHVCWSTVWPAPGGLGRDWILWCRTKADTRSYQTLSSLAAHTS